MPSPSYLGTLTGLNQLNTSNQFASPWLDLASQYAPQTIQSALYLCEFLYLNNSTYRKASEQIVNYFLTKIVLQNQDDEERKKFQKILEDDVRIMERLQEIGCDMMCYGNSFVSIFFPFTRVLVCSETNTDINIKKASFSFDPATMTFMAYSAKAGKVTKHYLKDYINKQAGKIKLVRWDPKRITIESNSTIQQSGYWYDIPAEDRNKILSGDRFFLETMPKEFIIAACRKQKFKFDNDCIFHMKEPCPAGVNLHGWGVPTILSAFKNFFRMQILLRYDETLMMDYIIPLRILSPAQGQYQDGNTIYNASMARWTGEMQSAVQRHRVDGADWNFFPFPVNYQAVGGEAKNLSPKDAIQYEEDRLLNSRGIPPEMYRTNMTIQAAPISLRLFERGHAPLVAGLNRLLQWSVTGIARFINSGDYTASLESVRIADDLEAKAWRIQAMSGGLISKETALSPMSIDPKEEYKRMLDQTQFEQRESERAQRESEMEQIGIGGSNSGDPAGEQSAGPSPIDLQGDADQRARNLLTLDDASRRRELSNLRQTNDVLHALVMKRIDQLRNMARSQGASSAMPQVLQNAPLPGQGTGIPRQ